MTDFSDLYDRFLSLIDNDVDRAEVKGHIAKMCATGTDSPEHKQSRRQLVRVLKSRAPHVLPASWLMNPSLEDGPTITPGAEIRKDWKDSMETDGLFFFGRTPTWEDIDKHYGSKGWGGDHRHPPAWGPDKRGVKPPHAPKQEPHGNEVGVRHMVVRLVALPEFRDNHEKLAEMLGRPGAAYRELVQFKGDDAYRQRLQEVYDRKFPEGSDLREAADEGAQMGGENFKLSAGSARGRRADEHQDPTVDAVDAGPALSEAKEIAGDPERGLSELDDTAKQLLRAHTKLSSYTTARGPMNAIRKGEAKLRSQKSRYQRLRNSGASTGEKLEAAQKVNDAAQDLLVHMGALQEVLADNPELRDAIGADEKAVAFLNKHLNGAHAVQAMTRAMLFTAKHEWNVNDAQDHERPAGPDEGADTYSFYGVPMNELEQMWDDIREAGLPGKLEFKMNAREEREPARVSDEGAADEGGEAAEAPGPPARLPAAEEPAAEEPAAEEPIDELSNEEFEQVVGPIMREEGLAFASDVGRKNLKAMVNEELGGADAKQKDVAEFIRGQRDDEKMFKPVAAQEAPEPPTPAPGAKPADVKPDAEPAAAEPASASEIFDSIPARNFPGNSKQFLQDFWRQNLLSRVKDEEKVEAAFKSLAEKLREVEAPNMTAARQQFLTLMEEFLVANELPLGQIKAWRKQRGLQKRLPLNGTRLPFGEEHTHEDQP